MTISAATIQRDASDAKNVTSCATSSAAPKRPAGTVAARLTFTAATQQAGRRRVREKPR
ncbi:MAG: hypothetical protein R3D69_16185 [Xanthobacteraceae bacterium]